jgi:hypothetical protein
MKDLNKIQEFFSKSVNEQADHVSPMVVKAYKEYLQAKKDGDGEKAYRYYSKKLNNTYSTRADRDAIETILKKKYGSAMEESVNEIKVDYDFSERELKRVLKLLGRGASTEIKMIKAFEKALGRELTKDELFETTEESVKEYNSGIYYDPAKEPNAEKAKEASKTGLEKVRDMIKKIMTENEGEDQIDTITMDVPLFIRILEYAREDAQDDMDLHDLAEKAIAGTKQQGMLSMDDYDMLVGDLEQIAMNEEEGYSQYLKDDPEHPEGKTKGLDTKTLNKILMRVVQDLDEKKKPGLWANIHAKRERGEKPSHGNSKAHKSAVAAGKRINKEK